MWYTSVYANLYMLVGSFMDKRDSETHGFKSESWFIAMVSWTDLIIYCETQIMSYKMKTIIPMIVLFWK